MNGWKTWTAAGLTAGLGIISIINGDTMGGMQQISAAVAMVGLGHKLDKATK